MKYLKRYNEELRPYIYNQAADKLAKLGHPKRADKLRDWGNIMHTKEEDRIIKKREDMGKEMGVYNVGLWNSKIKDALVITGKFYPYLYMEIDNLSSDYEEWREKGESLWIQITMGLIPADMETWDTISEYYDKDEVNYNTIICNTIEFNISDGYATDNDDEYDNDGNLVFSPSDPIFQPTGGFGFSPYYDSAYVAYFMDRNSAVRFKKALIGIFDGDIVINPTNEYPGGDKERLLDELCSERDRSLDEFESIIRSVRKINVNKLYKD